MKTSWGLVPLAVAGLTASMPAFAQGRADDYRRAERFLARNVAQLAPFFSIAPQWIDSGSRFWYRSDTAGGRRFLLVDPDRRSQQPAFDHVALAKALSTSSGKTYQALQLPFEAFTYVDGGRVIRFDVGAKTWRCSLQPVACDSVSEWKPASDEAPSPDGRQVAFRRSHDLYVRTVATGRETRLTDDGEPYYDYGTRPESNQTTATAKRLGWTFPSVVLRSPNSRHVLFQRLDQRNVGEMSLTQAVPPDRERPKTFGYRLAFPGDEQIPWTELWIADVTTGRRVKVQVEPIPMVLLTPIEFRLVWWSEDGERAYLIVEERGFKRLRFYEVNPANGAAREILEERSATYAEVYLDYYNRRPTVRVLRDSSEVLWYSERDGWAHVYRYDARSGALKNQVTSGSWVVRDVLYVDDARRQVYFTAGGREPGRNPYQRYLYRVNLDGSDLRLLTPENGDHRIEWSPDGRYFVDTYSRVDTLPVAVLRTADGKIVRRLGCDVDLSELKAMGWRWPEPFVVKAAGDTTSIYGVLYRPTNFDSTKTYPVIDAIYPGPQTIRADIAYPADAAAAYWYWDPQALAELGFIVVTIDGRGTPFRSKAFHDVSYGNLGDGGGLIDHVAGLRQLAARYPYMDITRVGITGGSSGGYAASRALLKYPEFYRVGVSVVPYSGPSAIVPWWSERYQGYPVNREAYKANDNEAVAGNLKGKLLIMIGELDEHANPTLAMRLVNALIAANKDFDMLIMPNRLHGDVGRDPYALRRMWDYFVRHLLRVEPPEGYRIQGPQR